MFYMSNSFLYLHTSQYKNDKMNIQELAKEISKETGEPAYKVSKMLASMVNVIRQQILKSQIVKLKSLLSIFVDVAPERNYYNVHQNRIDKLPRRFVLKVEPSKNLKKEIDAKKTY